MWQGDREEGGSPERRVGFGNVIQSMGQYL